MKKTLQKAKALNAVQASIEDAAAPTESGTGHSTSRRQASHPPPVVHKGQRPLRRRQGPEWACVEVLQENDEKGPCESTVRCRFCNVEFMADTARIREHLESEDSFDIVDANVMTAPRRQDENTSGTENSAFGASTPPVPPCEASLEPESKADREVALQWLRDYDMMQFCLRAGVSVTRSVAKARRWAEECELRAIHYPGKLNGQEAAKSASEAAAIVRQAAIIEWQVTDTLRFVGCGMHDDDCFKMVDIIKEAGALRELRKLSIAHNNITDAGFVALCEQLVTPSIRGENQTDGSGTDDGIPLTPAVSHFGKRLSEFSTFHNPIGDRGLMALAAALDAGGLPNLQFLDISGTALVHPDGSPRVMKVMERSMSRPEYTAKELAQEDGSQNVDAKARGRLSCGIGDAGITEFAYRLHHNKPTPGKPGMLTELRDLRLFSNNIGDEGLIALSMAFSERSKMCRNLEALWLQDNFIGDKGLCFMVESLFNGGMVNLRRLLLADNCITPSGAEAMSLALKRGSLAKLNKLSLSGNPLTKVSISRLSECLAERTRSFGGNRVVEIDLIPEPAQDELPPLLSLRSQSEESCAASVALSAQSK